MRESKIEFCLKLKTYDCKGELVNDGAEMTWDDFKGKLVNVGAEMIWDVLKKNRKLNYYVKIDDDVYAMVAKLDDYLPEKLDFEYVRTKVKFSDLYLIQRIPKDRNQHEVFEESLIEILNDDFTEKFYNTKLGMWLNGG